MKKIIIAGIIIIITLNAENYTIENLKDSFFGVVGKFNIETIESKQSTIIHIIDGFIEINKKHRKKFKYKYIRSISICLGERYKNRWNINTCGKAIKLEKNIFNDKKLQFKDKIITIPRKKEKTEWFIITIACGENKIGTCYIHDKTRSIKMIQNKDINSKEFYKRKYLECKAMLEVN